MGVRADFIYYAPCRRCVVSETEGNRLPAAAPLRVTDGHPTGWAFNSVPEGWDADINV